MANGRAVPVWVGNLVAYGGLAFVILFFGWSLLANFNYAKETKAREAATKRFDQQKKLDGASKNKAVDPKEDKGKAQDDRINKKLDELLRRADDKPKTTKQALEDAIRHLDRMDKTIVDAQRQNAEVR